MTKTRNASASLIARAAGLALFALAAAAQAQTHERTLANGMKVLVVEDRRAPTVVHMVWYRAGSIDEVNGRTGVAHVLEHLMFKGTRTLAPGEFSRRVAAMGGRENAFTSRDYTGYFQQIHKSRLSEVMALEADRMTNLQITDDDFEREIKVVMEERRLRTEDRAQGQVFEQLMASSFVASPVRAPVVGWMADLQAMTVHDTRNWYRDWYAPNNALLVVAGDVDAQSAFELAERNYGKIASRALPARKPQQEPEQRGVRRAWVKAPAENPSIVAGFKVPKLEDVERDVEPYALEMLAAVLDNDENGRVTRNLVRGSRVADQADVGYDMTSRGPTLFTISGTPARGRSTDELERALRDEIRKIAEHGVGEDELSRVKTQYRASRVYKRDSIFAQAMEAASLEVIGFSHADSDRMLERIGAVSSQQVQAVARKYFSEDALTVVTLVPVAVASARVAAPAGTRH